MAHAGHTVVAREAGLFCRDCGRWLTLAETDGPLPAV